MNDELLKRRWQLRADLYELRQEAQRLWDGVRTEGDERFGGYDLDLLSDQQWESLQANHRRQGIVLNQIRENWEARQ